MHRFLQAMLLAMIPAPSVGAADLWELPPILYSDTAATDPVAKLAVNQAGEAGKAGHQSPLDRLRFVLKRLDVPEESQILVFSKTSKQNSLITPGNPRCLFFSENAYVGYVPGGDMEVIAHDPLLGPVFYLIEAGDGNAPLKITRDTSDCLSCHGTARTESVPGVLVRSVFPDENGQPILPLGTFQTDHSSPIRERWGGYYVTGRGSPSHLGNRTYQKSARREFPAESPELVTLAGKIDTTKYLRPTSDIVSLMVLEHQCLVQNLLVSAAMNYRRAHFLRKSLDPNADPDAGDAGKHADEAAAKIVEALLFANEAPLGANGVEGDPAFQEAFGRRFPKTRDGRSLADFQLNDRLFKHRCSYMVYSAAFASLPARVKSAVIERLRGLLESEPAPGAHPEIKTSERRKILSILAETLPGWDTP